MYYNNSDMKKQLNYTLNRDYWFCCDFETIHERTEYYKINNDTRIILFHAKNWNNTINQNGTNIEDFWKFILDQNNSCTLFFHNLKFDGDFILKYLINHAGYKFNNTEDRVNKGIQVFRQGGRIYYMKIFLRKKVAGKVKDINIYIRCSLQLLSSNIASLGKSLGIEKLDEEQASNADFYVVEPEDDITKYRPDFVAYCERDTEIMRLSLIKFEEAISTLEIVKKYNSNKKNKPFNVFNSLTVAGLSRRLMKMYSKNYIFENNLDIYKPLQISLEDFRIIAPFYRGGWTQINPEFIGAPKCVETGIMLDVVSAYPFQMTMPIPYGQILTSEPDCKYYYEFISLKIKSAKIKPKYANCPILKNWKKDKENAGRYVLELKNFECFYLAEEWEWINKFYDIEVKEQYSYFMKAEHFLKDYAEEVISKKTQYGLEGKSAFKQAMKILANSAYGCLAMREKFDTCLYFKEQELNALNINIKDRSNNSHLFLNNKEYEFLRISENYTVGDNYLSIFDCKEEKDKKPNKAAAAVITALQRCYLWSMIDKIGVEHFGLSDTDSILFVNLSKQQIKEIEKMTSDKLGGWEKENKKDIHYFGTYGAKKYELLDENKQSIKLKMSGLTLNNIDFKDCFSTKYDMDEPELKIENAVLGVEYKYSGIMLVSKDKIFKKGGI